MQFLSHCYSAQARIWKDDSQFGHASDQIYSLAKDQYSSKYVFLKFDVLLIDSVLRVNVYVHALRGYRKEIKQHNKFLASWLSSTGLDIKQT
jgi:hypothetical protein